jgi:antitoxin ParD1/3/4
MSTIRKTITVTDQQDTWIGEQVRAGRFTNDSEVIRDLNRREQERSSADLETVRQALMAGEHSGEPQRFDFAEFSRRKLAQHSA